MTPALDRIKAGRNIRIGRAFRHETAGAAAHAERAWCAVARWERVLVRLSLGAAA